MDHPAWTKRERARLAAIRQALVNLRSDLSLEHAISLVTIALEPGLSVNELADRIGAPQQSASRYAAALLGRYQNPLAETEREPLIIQRVNAEDPRKRALFLNDNGREVIARMMAGAGDHRAG
jgi:DNA-binding MarR family transcriptional regulator